MAEEECREMARNNYAAQMEMLGYQTDGNPKDMVEVVRCKDCAHYLNGRCYSRVSDRINFTVDIPDDWFCADGKRKEE